MRGRSLALLFILASLAASLAPVAPAGAAFGDLSYRGCISETEGFGCQTQGGFLDEAEGFALSHDGRSLYVASFGRRTLTAFDRGGDGSLSFSDCASQAMLPGCTDLLPASSAEGAFGVAVSPDDASVYMTSFFGDAVLHFVREPGGALAFGGCIASDFLQGCDNATGDPIDGPVAVAVSPDGSSVYFLSAFNDSISHFAREPTGQLNFGDCLASNPVDPCGNLDDSPLDSPREVAVSPDGRFVYATAGLSDSIVRFKRAPTGQLAFDGCLGDGGGSGCVDPPGGILDGVDGLAISPDGRFLYVTGAMADTVVQYAMDGAGGLSFVSCLIAGEARQGCTGIPEESLLEPRSIAISPDGRSVYVGALESGTLVYFSRDPGNGRMTFASCFSGDADAADSGCIDLPGQPLEAPEHVAVSADGASVYVSDWKTNAIATFSRSLSDSAPPVGPSPPRRPTARCAGKPATIVGTPRRDVLRGTPRRDVIAGLGGDDTIRGRGGNDLICGGGGKDLIVGGGGRDRLLGGGGADSLRGGAERDRCLGGAGRDDDTNCERKQGRRG